MCRQGNVGTVSTGLTASGIGRIPEIDEESKAAGGGRAGERDICQCGNC